MLARVQRSYGKARLRSEAPTASAPSVPAAPSHRHSLAPASSVSTIASSALPHSGKDAVNAGPGQVLTFAARIRHASDSSASHCVKSHLSAHLFPLSMTHWPCSETFTNSNFDFSPASLPPSSTKSVLAHSSSKASCTDSINVSFRAKPILDSMPHSTTGTTRGALSPAPTGRMLFLSPPTGNSCRPMTSEMKKRDQAIMRERRYRSDQKLRKCDARDVSPNELLGYVGRELERWMESSSVERDEDGCDKTVSWPGRWKEDYDYALYEE